MPVNFYRRERYQDPEDETIANSISALQKGFLGGFDIARQRRKDTLADAYLNARIRKAQAEERELNEPLPMDPQTGEPLFYRVGGQVRNNPNLGRRVNPRYAAMVESGMNEYGEPLPSAYRQALGRSLGVGGPFAPNLQPSKGIGAPSLQSAEERFLDPLELEAQNAIAQGRDPVLVKQRLAQLRGGRG